MYSVEFPFQPNLSRPFATLAKAKKYAIEQCKLGHSRQVNIWHQTDLVKQIDWTRKLNRAWAYIHAHYPRQERQGIYRKVLSGDIPPAVWQSMRKA